MTLKQENRSLHLKTALGDDQLLLTSFQGREEMSRLFSYTLEMISDDPKIAPKSIVGTNVTFSVRRTDNSFRHFNGFVSRFSAGVEREGRRTYRAEVVPWLWFLTRTADCRIFQNKTIKQIIAEVFQDLGMSDVDDSQVKGHHPVWEYCVQYRESAFNFVSRLMEEEGIFFFFKHEEGKHTLVMADQAGAYKDCPEKEVDLPLDTTTIAIDDHLTSWEHCYEFRTGKWAQTDYNFETPSTSLMANTEIQGPAEMPGAKKYEVFDYPGSYDNTGDGKPLTDLRMQEEETAFDVVQAAGLCKTFTPGGKFKVKQHPSKNEANKGYVITSIAHVAHETLGYESGDSAPFDYRNTFTCIPDSVVFRPARITPKPVVQGVQTAVVTGPAGEEIFPDKYGRVKVQFFWDRKGKKDENTSCWMRVSQVHAGKNFGGIDIPRIGEEVIVSFLEGDPDLPLISGRVYHAENMPPFGLPASKNISGLKSNSTLGGGGYNEYVMDDTKGNELIREHGQFDKDSTIEHDLREHVLHDRSRDVTNDETVQVGHDRKKTIGNDETTQVGSNRTENVGKNESITIGSSRTENVGKDEKITIGGARTESVAKDESVSISGGRSHTVGKSDTLNVGKALSITAGDSITLTTGSASISMKKDGTITIKGKDITIEGSGKINGKAGGDMILKGSKIAMN